MKFIVLLFATMLCSMFVQAQKNDPVIYRCLPCGNDCDNGEYDAVGKCAHCGMQLVPASSITFRNISPATICDYIKEHPETVLLDVRTRAEYEGKASPNFGTLKGAINIPIQELSQRLLELQKFRNKEILVFCSHNHRSPQAAYLLTQNGFTKVANMFGGMSVVRDATCKD
ncbi:MAG: rhodanese-like domain-containing protein [Bacteroidota bacterium]|nr:rhodanese-like domain-containing protein [Bacteroidota bacterium]